jgi:hypothetical protein
MASRFKQIVVASALTCILACTAGCPRRAATATPPGGGTTAAPSQQARMIPDQVNTAGWDRAWTNLVNDVQQSFIPTLPRLTAVEVDLVVGNPGPTDDLLTLTVLDAHGRALAVVSKRGQTRNCDQVIFVIPKRGVEVTPGQTYSLKLSGGVTFGWKYMVGGYANGEAAFNGKPLLRDVRSTFMFQTFGAN